MQGGQCIGRVRRVLCQRAGMARLDGTEHAERPAKRIGGAPVAQQVIELRGDRLLPGRAGRAQLRAIQAVARQPRHRQWQAVAFGIRLKVQQCVQ